MSDKGKKLAGVVVPDEKELARINAMAFKAMGYKKRGGRWKAKFGDSLYVMGWTVAYLWLKQNGHLKRSAP